jgi:hypothetical protein
MKFTDYINKENLNEEQKSLIELSIDQISTIQKQLQVSLKSESYDDIVRICDKSLISISDLIKNEAVKEKIKKQKAMRMNKNK